MNSPAADGAALGLVSDALQQLWVELATQLTPFTSVITIPGHVFAELNTSSCIWLADQYQAMMESDDEVLFARDTQMDRVFFGSESLFSEDLLLRFPGSMPFYSNAPHAASTPAASVSSTMVDRHSVSQSAKGKVAKVSSKADKIPRPANAFILYRKDHHDEVKAANPGIHNNDISVIIGAAWQKETADIRQAYKALAEKMKLEHAQKYPEYSYKPRKPSEKKKRMSKKKAAAMAGAPSDPEDPSNPSGMVDLQDDMSLPAGEMQPALDFGELGGSWAGMRTANVPSTVHLPNLIRRHNFQQNGVETGRPSVPVDFGPSAEFTEVQYEDLNAIGWEQGYAHTTDAFNADQEFYGYVSPSELVGVTVAPGDYLFNFDQFA